VGNVLAQDAMIEEWLFDKQCTGVRCSYRGERVLASNALVQGMMGRMTYWIYKCDFTRTRT